MASNKKYITNIYGYQVVREARGTLLNIIVTNIVKSPTAELVKYFIIWAVIRYHISTSWFTGLWIIALFFGLDCLFQLTLNFKGGKHSLDMRQLGLLYNKMHWTKYNDIGIEKMWLNSVIKHLWPSMRAFIKSSFNDTPLGWSFSMDEVDIGGEPLLVSAIHAVDRADKDGHTIVYDLIIHYSSSEDMRFLFTCLKFIRLGISHLKVRARVRLVLHLNKFMVKQAPVIKSITFAFENPPNVAYCKALGLCKWFALFTSLNEFVRKMISNYLVLPRSVVFEFEHDMCLLAEGKMYEPTAIVKVDILFATNLSSMTDTLMGRKPNSFCALTLGDSKKLTTKTIPDSDDPIWNQSFTIPVSSTRLNLTIELHDSMNDSHELLHKLEYEDIEERFGHWTKNGKEKLESVSRGKATLVFRVSILELKEAKPDIQTAKALSELRLPMGVLAVLVDTAYGVQKLPTHHPLYSQVLKTFVKVSLGNQTRCTDINTNTGNTPYWGKVFTFIVYQPTVESLFCQINARIGETNYPLGECVVPISKVYSDKSHMIEDHFYLDGLVKDSHLNLYMIYRPVVPQKELLTSYKASMEKVLRMAEQNKRCQERKSEEEEDEERRGKFEQVWGLNLSNRMRLDVNMNILLRFVWTKMSDLSGKFFVEVIQVTQIPPVNGFQPNPYVVIELLDEGTIKEKRVTTTKSASNDPTYNEIKYFENFNVARTKYYRFRISLHTRSVKRPDYSSKLAEKVIEFPSEWRIGESHYRNWYSLDIVQTVGIQGETVTTCEEEQIETEKLIQLPDDQSQQQQRPMANTTSFLRKCLPFLRILSPTNVESKKSI